MAGEMTLREFVTRIPADQRIPGDSWLVNGVVHGTIPAIEHIYPVDRKLRILLFQNQEFWSCVAEVPLRPDRGNIAYVRFSVLGYIELWNSRKDHCRINNTDFQIKLEHDIERPTIYRHPAMMPMTIKFDKRKNVFEKELVYYKEDVGAS